MRFTEYGYKMHDEKHQRFYCMTMADLKIDLMQYTVEKKKTDLKIRLVDCKTGEVAEFSNTNELLLTDLNNGYKIDLFDVHAVHMNSTNEDIIVVCFRDSNEMI